MGAIVFLRKWLASFALLALIGLISLSFADPAFAHVASEDFDHQRIHEMNKIFEDYGTNYSENFMEKNNEFTKSSEFLDEDLLDSQTLTEKKLINFYQQNNMIKYFGNGKSGMVNKWLENDW